MTNQNKVIIALIVLIIILVAIFGLKVMGIIKPKTKDTSITNQIEKVSENNENINEQEEKKNSRLFMAEDEEKSKIKIYLIIMFVIEYLVSGIAIYKIAKSKEIGNSWIAFVPIFQTLLESKIGYGNIGLGLLYIIGNATQQVWNNNIFELVVSVIGLIILYGIFCQISDKPNNKLGNLVAFEILTAVIGVLLYVKTISIFWLAFISMGPRIVGWIYVFYLSKKCETNVSY